MPWLAIPHGNKCKKLTRYFGLSGLPTLDMIDPDRKTLKNNVANIIDEHGVEAWEGFPLSAESWKFLQIRFLYQNLREKTVLLYFSAKRRGPESSFLPTLVKEYNKIKERNKDFEIAFISSDRDQNP
ncbi:hypothetical protein PR202_gn00281 [Eleusine coracana subsp. coracana]|uniref:protein-disulfide reductase n=1 Tax=Eleusine coracana subsp. coracana TaxID=191504 RepID=A0AAV5G1H6_ELECO|nr:hypothetical protein PR202_gn00176 [Eleusine coracana subsp. coracana]GJN40966.1 hypothetical protein PR202_gn00281 [Eleusine coracana subsp. coracana]